MILWTRKTQHFLQQRESLDHQTDKNARPFGCICISKCKCVCKCLCVCTCTCTCGCLCICVCTCTSTFKYIQMSISIIEIYMHMYMHRHMLMLMLMSMSGGDQYLCRRVLCQPIIRLCCCHFVVHIAWEAQDSARAGARKRKGGRRIY